MRRNHSNRWRRNKKKKTSPRNKMNHLKEKCRAAYCRKQSSRQEGREGLKIIQRWFFLFLNENICCDTSLEPSRRDGSDEGHNICFNGIMWKTIPKLSLCPFFSVTLRKPRQLIRMKHCACIRKRVLLFVNTGDTQGIIPISLTVLLCLRQYLIELRPEKQIKFKSFIRSFSYIQTTRGAYNTHQYFSVAPVFVKLRTSF